MLEESHVHPGPVTFIHFNKVRAKEPEATFSPLVEIRWEGSGMPLTIIPLDHHYDDELATSIGQDGRMITYGQTLNGRKIIRLYNVADS